MPGRENQNAQPRERPRKPIFRGESGGGGRRVRGSSGTERSHVRLRET